MKFLVVADHLCGHSLGIGEQIRIDSNRLNQNYVVVALRSSMKINHNKQNCKTSLFLFMLIILCLCGFYVPSPRCGVAQFVGKKVSTEEWSM